MSVLFNLRAVGVGALSALMAMAAWSGHLIAEQGATGARSTARSAPQASPAPPRPVVAATRVPVAEPDASLIQKYCITCHNARAKTGGLSLESMPPADASAHAEIWEKVARKIRGGMMPP